MHTEGKNVVKNGMRTYMKTGIVGCENKPEEIKCSR
jgi:hypothetical protein